MRIIDKNTDFYDYLQNVYRDCSIIFDRTDSFILTKEIMCEHLQTYNQMRWSKNKYHDYNFVLLQVCHTFWLFLVEVTKTDKYDGRPLEYTTELMATWKNYNKPRELIHLDVITFPYTIVGSWLDNEFWRHSKQSVQKRMDAIVKAIDASDYKVVSSMNKHMVYYGDGKRVEKHIPLLKASGFSSDIEPLEIYLAFEEYFSLEKTASERIYSDGITDVEKIENHGFDTKTSFRGK